MKTREDRWWDTFNSAIATGRDASEEELVEWARVVAILAHGPLATCQMEDQADAVREM